MIDRIVTWFGRLVGRLLRREFASGVLELVGIACIVLGVAGWSTQAAQVLIGVVLLAASWRWNR